jgi:hypothetical protein
MLLLLIHKERKLPFSARLLCHNILVSISRHCLLQTYKFLHGMSSQKRFSNVADTSAIVQRVSAPVTVTVNVQALTLPAVSAVVHSTSVSPRTKSEPDTRVQTVLRGVPKTSVAVAASKDTLAPAALVAGMLTAVGHEIAGPPASADMTQLLGQPS